MKKDVFAGGMVKMHVIAKLQDFGFEKTDNRKEIQDNMFYASPPSRNSKGVVFTLASKERANEACQKLKGTGITTQWSAEKPNNFKVNIRSNFKVASVATKPTAVDQSLVDTAVIVTADKSKERLAVEGLLDEKGITYTSEAEQVGETELMLTFADAEAFAAAQQILAERKVECVPWDGNYELLISLAIPDVLLNGNLPEENDEERAGRIAADYEIRLQFFLKRKLNLIVHTVGGVTKKKLSAANHILYGAIGTVRRLDFFDVKSKEKAWSLLTEIGFACSNPASKEKATIMVDLAESKYTVLLQNISTEMLTLQDIALKFANDPELAPSSNRSSVQHNGVRCFAQYFETEQQALLAVKLLQFEVDGVEAYKKAIFIPYTSVAKTKRRSTKLSSATPKPATAPKAEPVSAVPAGSNSDQILEIYKAKLSEEVAGNYQKRIAELEAALKTANDELSKANEKLEKNHLIAKNGTPTIIIPISEINKGVTIDGVKGVIIDKKLLVQN